MSLPLRIMLIIASVLTGFYIRKKLQKSQMQIADVVFWMLFGMVLILMSIFPDAVVWLTELIGVQSPVNFVFLVVIFLVIVRCFSLSVKVSLLEAKLQQLVEDDAVSKTLEEEKNAGNSSEGKP
ncbi:MAG: DUF2304 domain-containing protein [Lachnospiraceae bacterium]|nr:DUF2304 domain-containing protein [Lachnospiraceae bacterium]